MLLRPSGKADAVLVSGLRPEMHSPIRVSAKDSSYSFKHSRAGEGSARIVLHYTPLHTHTRALSLPLTDATHTHTHTACRLENNAFYAARHCPLSPLPPSPGSTSVFDRLTDHRGFTGTHKHRFDGEGRGVGLRGREEGYEVVTKTTAAVPIPALVPYAKPKSKA